MNSGKNTNERSFPEGKEDRSGRNIRRAKHLAHEPPRGSAGIILAGEFLPPALEHAGKDAGAPGEATEVLAFEARIVPENSLIGAGLFDSAGQIISAS